MLVSGPYIRKTGAFSISGGYSTTDGIIAELSVSESNFLGRGQYARVAVTGGQRLPINSSGRAEIKTGQSCNIAVPLAAILYTPAGTVVQVIRRNRVETKRVEVGLTDGGQVEIRDGLAEGDVVVARAGSLLREGDPVRPVMAAEAK